MAHATARMNANVIMWFEKLTKQLEFYVDIFHYLDSFFANNIFPKKDTLHYIEHIQNFFKYSWFEYNIVHIVFFNTD